MLVWDATSAVRDPRRQLWLQRVRSARDLVSVGVTLDLGPGGVICMAVAVCRRLAGSIALADRGAREVGVSPAWRK
jgi:hypothetical protein